MAGSTNFLEWNPNKANQETDSQYAADVQRITGLQLNSITPSPTANKIFRQSSVMVAALGQALAAKGYTVSDASTAALAAILANLVTQADNPILSLPLLIGGGNSQVSQPKETIYNVTSSGFYVFHYYYYILIRAGTGAQLQVETDWTDPGGARVFTEALTQGNPSEYLSRSLPMYLSAGTNLQIVTTYTSQGSPAMQYGYRFQLMKVA